MNAYRKDIWRTIRGGWKRFVSILIITALGVGMMSGLYASCQDMFYSADRFYDAQRLFDVRILSTLGLTEDDVTALKKLPEVEKAAGGYTEIVTTTLGEVEKKAEVSVLDTVFNVPLLLEGQMPSKSGEIAVTEKYMMDSGAKLGEEITIVEEVEEEEEEETTATDDEFDFGDEEGDAENKPNFRRDKFTITALVLDPQNIQATNENDDFRGNATVDYPFFVTATDVDYEVYTVVHLGLKGAAALHFYEDDYKDMVTEVVTKIESSLRINREQARDNQVMGEATEKIQRAEKKMNDKFAEVEAEFADGRKELADGRLELDDGERELRSQENSAQSQLATGQQEIDNNRVALNENEKQLAAGEEQLAAGEAALNRQAELLVQNKETLAAKRAEAETEFGNYEKQLAEGQAQLAENQAALEEAVAALQAAYGEHWPEAEFQALVGAARTLTESGMTEAEVVAGTAAEQGALALVSDANTVQTGLGLGIVYGNQTLLEIQKQELAAQKAAAFKALDDADAQLVSGEQQLKAAQAELEANKQTMTSGRTALEDGKRQLGAGQATLDSQSAEARRQLDEGWNQIAEGRAELAEGERELAEGEAEYNEKKAEAELKIKDAYAELAKIDTAKWYVQDRSSLESYASLDSDLSSIAGIGKIFPVIFLTVAVLMSLTTMTRMVEEERSLIGTYKALGYTNREIYHKYILFALMASLVGSLFGDLFGFIFMPKFIAVILEYLYILPEYFLRFDIPYGLGSPLLFMVAIVGATFLACRKELQEMPAMLLRPKTPRSGARVWLERVTPIWRRISFLNKVTVRNLFRYKKRLLMTVGGIAGCTALILCGFAIKDSVIDLPIKQYQHINSYDLMAVFEPEENDDLVQSLVADEKIDELMNLRIETVKILGGAGDSTAVQLFVVPTGRDISDYIYLENLKDKEIALDTAGPIVTENAMNVLELTEGDTLLVRNDALTEGEVAVAGVVHNYLGNNIYMTQAQYEKLFGVYEPNAVLAKLTPAVTDPGDYTAGLADQEGVLTALSSAEQQESFAFELIDAVVMLLIVMAGGLAFAVLFTLSNTNISERIRELATIKVLGFYDLEVHQYVNKETLLLTLIGILVGLPLGRFLSELLTAALNMPGIFFAVHIKTTSYLISAGITLLFALIVNLTTNRVLDKINMVEALKSVE